MEVRRGERLLELTRTEFLLLELLMHHPRQVLSRAQIFDQVWGYDFGPSSNSLEVYIGYLRRKTEAAGESRILHTVARGRLRPAPGSDVTLRRRMALASAGAVALTVAITAVIVYVVVRHDERGQIDALVAPVPSGSARAKPPRKRRVGATTPSRVQFDRGPFGGPGGYLEIVDATGKSLGDGPLLLPITRQVRQVAAGTTQPFLADKTVRGTHVRVFTATASAGGAVIVARPLGEVDHELFQLRVILAFVVLAGIVAGGGLGLLVARGVHGTRAPADPGRRARRADQ